MIACITKYALSAGIECRNVEETHTPTMVIDAEDRFRSPFHGEGEEWHRTPESALHRAEEMCHKKIESLKKQIKKLEALKIVAPHGPKETV